MIKKEPRTDTLYTPIKYICQGQLIFKIAVKIDAYAGQMKGLKSGKKCWNPEHDRIVYYLEYQHEINDFKYYG